MSRQVTHKDNNYDNRIFNCMIKCSWDIIMGNIRLQNNMYHKIQVFFLNIEIDRWWLYRDGKKEVNRPEGDTKGYLDSGLQATDWVGQSRFSCEYMKQFNSCVIFINYCIVYYYY